MKSELINAPAQNTREMIMRRVRHGVSMDGVQWGAVLLVQGSVSEVMAAADIGVKNASVMAVELVGNCPQHVNTVAFIGSAAQVEQVVSALKTGGRI